MRVAQKSPYVSKAAANSVRVSSVDRRALAIQASASAPVISVISATITTFSDSDLLRKDLTISAACWRAIPVNFANTSGHESMRSATSGHAALKNGSCSIAIHSSIRTSNGSFISEGRVNRSLPVVRVFCAPFRSVYL